ncbi:2-dehydro-3-deoxygalactonokinase [Sphingomonas sp. PAMC 26617]|uniref:2-dehydro-3-deoxygalactonokinase n=1 Tax=Sphingomonas sp. PAMC 26617 TaxID=1112216 RepID=UPI000287AEE5|nr:2-dehydro-3-deoxygalactonokinase [Sphingomonas sp. PAMC 26617]
MVVSTPAFIAIDWGTTNRRAYPIDAAGGVIETLRDDQGVLSMAQASFAPAVAGLRARFGDVPVICAGMVGSTRGWAEVPYRSCPAGIEDLVDGIFWVEPGRTAIVPGVAIRNARSDVMRGEEVQLLGAVAAGMAPADATLCQPGTHCKWARMEAGRIAGFRTAMTGEMFALLRNQSVLSEFLKGKVIDGAAFRDGLALASEGHLLSDLFGERAAAVLGLRDPSEIASRVSGLLIGTDVNEQAIAIREPVHILADPALGSLYAAAVVQAGGAPILLDSHRAFLAGITAIWDKIDDR